jgi:glycosyltransferase involved in cell wall biosynthesis
MKSQTMDLCSLVADFDGKKDGSTLLVTIVVIHDGDSVSLKRCIASIADQTYERIESIVIASETSAVLEDAFGGHSRTIPCNIIKPQGGVAETMNRSLSQAKGEFIVFIRSSCRLYPFAVQRNIRAIRECGAAASAGCVDIMNLQGSIEKVEIGSLDEAICFGAAPAALDGILISKELFSVVGLFDTEMLVAYSQEWIIRAIKKNVEFTRINCSTVARALETIHDPGRWLSEYTRIIRGHLPELSEEQASEVIGIIHGEDASIDIGKAKAILDSGPLPASFRNFLERRIYERAPDAWKFFSESRCALTNNPTYPEEGVRQPLGPIVEGGRRTRGKPRSADFARPLVSIVTVVYNGEKHLEHCILSVANQHYKNIEHIIIDGGSTDSTLDILRTYDDLLEYWKSEPDKGIYDGMNKGLALARGEYIVMLNSDDFFFPDAIELSVDAIIEAKADYSVAGCLFVDGEKPLGKKMPESPCELALFNYSIASHQTYVVNRSCYEIVGEYDTKYRIAADFKFRNLLILNAQKYCVIEKAIVLCNVDGISTQVSNRDICLVEVLDIITSQFSLTHIDNLMDFIILVSEKRLKNDIENKYIGIIHELGLSEEARREVERLVGALLSERQAEMAKVAASGMCGASKGKGGRSLKYRIKRIIKKIIKFPFRVIKNGIRRICDLMNEGRAR